MDSSNPETTGFSQSSALGTMSKPPWLRAENLWTTLVVCVIKKLVYSVDEPVVVGLPDHVPRVRKDGDFQVLAVLSVLFDMFWFEQRSLGTTAY